MSEELNKILSKLDRLDKKLASIDNLVSKLESVEHKLSSHDLTLMKINDSILKSANEAKETRRYVEAISKELNAPKADTSNPGLLHEEVVKFLQTFGSELNRMYGAYGPNQMAINVQPRFMHQPPIGMPNQFQQPTYVSSPYGNTSMYKPNCQSTGSVYTMKPNGFENYQMGANSGLVQPTFTTSYGTSDTHQHTENIDNEVQEEAEQLNSDEKSQDDVSETVFSGMEYTGSLINRVDWLNRLKEVGISSEIVHAPDFVFRHLALGAYKNLAVRSNVYPNKVLQPGYVWYPGILIHKNTNTYQWYIVKLVG